MRSIELLRKGAHHNGPRGVGETRQLLEVFVHVMLGAAAFERRTHEDGPLNGRRQGDDFATDVSFPGSGDSLRVSARCRSWWNSGPSDRRVA